MKERPSGHESRVGSSRLPGLDVLRGVAIALVMIQHGWPQIVGGAGVVGVGIFFSLSGYLITGLLVTQFRRTNGLHYGRFYRNRILRLYPALVVMATVVIAVALVQGASTGAAVWSFVVAAFYLGNVPPLIKHNVTGIGHVWTLATEEQFYLIWPVLLAFALRRRRERLLVIVLLVGAIGVALVMTAVRWSRPTTLYVWPTSWAVTLLVGCAAFLFREVLKSLAVRPVVPLVAIVVLAVLCRLQLKTFALTFSIGTTVIGVAAAALILWAAGLRSVPVPFVPLRWLGLISYAAYLWDYPIQVWVDRKDWGLAGSLLVVGLTLGAATLSWFALERPIAEWRRRRDRKAGVVSSARRLREAVGAPLKGDEALATVGESAGP